MVSPSSDPLRFAALLAYTPRFRDIAGIGDGPRKVMGWVKDARRNVLRRIAELCKAQESKAFKGTFGPDVTLVPVPRSAPRRTPDTLWPGLSLATALQEHALGRDVQELLVRTRAVPDAHGSAGDERPTVSTLSGSLRWRGDLGSNLERIVLVDDVVTRGTTFLSARDVIQDIQPGLEVEGFAAIRTMSFEVVENPLDPVTGTITLTADGRWGLRKP